MHCLDESLLQKQVEGSLDESEALAVRAHLGTCPACREKIVQYKQLMWDLQQPAEQEIPVELEALQKTLMAAWHDRQSQEKRDRRQRQTRSLIPSWAGNTFLWPRHVPPVDFVGGIIARAGTRMLDSVLPFKRQRKRKGDGRR